MANIPTSNNQISIHLSDRALTPLVSSSNSPASSSSQSQSQAQQQALSSLTSTAITAYDSASRLGLGIPQRIMIETRSSGPVILHSYINPQSSQRSQARHIRNQEYGRGIVEQAREDLRPLSGTTESSATGQRRDDEGLVNGVESGGDELGVQEGEDDVEEDGIQQPPLLIASVVAAHSTDALEARRAAARLERMGREFQREWGREQEEQNEIITMPEDG